MAKSKNLKRQEETNAEKRQRLKSLREETMRITGWTRQQYTKAYDVYKHKVRAYNLLAGANVSPTEAFYYTQKVIEAQKSGRNIELFGQLETIQSLSSATGKISTKTALKVQEDILEHFKPLIEAQPLAQAYTERLKSGELTIEEYSLLMRSFAKQHHQNLKDSAEYSAMYGSD